MFKLFSFVFIGGGLGSVARLGIARLLAQFVTTALPLATFGVNIIGSLLVGLLWALPAVSEKASWTHFLIVGFCGGFTTFSAFSWENFSLLKQGNVFLFFAYAFLSIALFLWATWGGYVIGKSLT